MAKSLEEILSDMVRGQAEINRRILGICEDLVTWVEELEGRVKTLELEREEEQ